MTPIQLEALTLRTVDQVRAGQPVEDAQVELKRVLPADPYKAARRVGGHANASRGQPVVWIIGLDEDEGVTGADKAELSDWWPQVQRYFDDLPPELLLQPMNVPVEGDDGERLTVVALAFDTSRLPFIVTAKGQAGPIQREVPYRDATGVRSAKRGDIIRLLDAATTVPQLRPMYAEVYAETEPDYAPPPEGGDAFYKWRAKLHLYATLAGEQPAIIAAHGVTAAIHLPYSGERPPQTVRLGSVRMTAPDGSRTVTESTGDIIIERAGRFHIEASGAGNTPPPEASAKVRPTFRVHPLEASGPQTFRFDFTGATDDTEVHPHSRMWTRR